MRSRLFDREPVEVDGPKNPHVPHKKTPWHFIQLGNTICFLNHGRDNDQLISCESANVNDHPRLKLHFQFWEMWYPQLSYPISIFVLDLFVYPRVCLSDRTNSLNYLHLSTSCPNSTISIPSHRRNIKPTERQRGNVEDGCHNFSRSSPQTLE